MMTSDARVALHITCLHACCICNRALKKASRALGVRVAGHCEACQGSPRCVSCLGNLLRASGSGRQGLANRGGLLSMLLRAACTGMVPWGMSVALSNLPRAASGEQGGSQSRLSRTFIYT